MRSGTRALAVWLACAFAAAGLSGAPARAQEELEDVFGGFGTAEKEEAAPGQAGLFGQVFDGETGNPIQGVSVIVKWPPPADGSEPRLEVQVTDLTGAFEFPSLPAGTYDITFSKAGYRASTMTNVVVVEGQENRADFPLPPLPSATAGEVLELEAFVVEAETVGEMLTALELRMDADALLNVMSAEDLSRFAATDVADAIRRVAGVNVVEGQFAIIRGLEDRYSSTTYNGAPVPSPDPDRQSVQLDLFPAEIVDNLVVTKSFAPYLPSNSAGGSIDILTLETPEELALKVKFKGGFNENAIDRFLAFEPHSPVGNEESGLADAWDREAGGVLKGRAEVADRELRFKLLGNWEVGYDTAFGYQEEREPRAFYAGSPVPGGDLSSGELTLTAGRFDLTTSERAEQTAAFGGLGLDLDPEGNHKLDLSVFWTRKDEDTVQLRENGYLPGYDYSQAVQQQQNGDQITFDFTFNGAINQPPGNATLASWIAKAREGGEGTQANFARLWFASFFESKSFETERDLLVPQLNGAHVFPTLPGLEIRWAANYAKTTQTESALGARMRYEPCGYGGDPQLICPAGVSPIDIPTVFPVNVASLGPGKFIGDSSVFASFNDISEEQWFGRLDADYERQINTWLTGGVRLGGWYEQATRGVDSRFVDVLNIQADFRCIDQFIICGGDTNRPVVFGDTAQQLGQRIFGNLFLLDAPNQPILDVTSDGTREIGAFAFEGRSTLWGKLDLLAGVRVESIRIESLNDPFAGGLDTDRTPAIFPSKFVIFDPFDNPDREPPGNPPFTYQVLGLDLPSGPCRARSGGQGQPPPPGPAPGREGETCIDFVTREEIEGLVNGDIDELLALPSVGLTYRPLDGLVLRAAYSQTTARPSFREMGYYVSVEPGSDDQIIGNPQLQLSDVESWDARIEYVFGDGDLLGMSGFYKTIQDPIEAIIVRDPTNFLDDYNSALFRTFFNNPNEATLWGIELEARKNLGFAGEWLRTDFLDYFTVGGNFTWIDAEVGRTQAELARSQRFFANNSGQLEKTRRLFGQPEWIANADLSFDHPGWGTQFTLAFYAISDLLDAAGAATIGAQGQIEAFTLDRYIDSFHTLDLVVRQRIWGGLDLKLNLKNLTDSERGVSYDAAQLSSDIHERQFRVGRSYSLELRYEFAGGELGLF
jgi:outer membrane receptor protein involved in Fe transport